MPSTVSTSQHVHRAEELGDERRGRVLVELLRRPHLLDLPLVQHDDLVGDLERLLLVVGDEQAGDVDLVVEPAEPGAQLVAHLRRRARRRARRAAAPWAAAPAPAPGPRAAAGRPRAATGSGRRSPRAARGRAARRPARGSRPCVGELLDLQAEGDVLADRHVAEQRVVLEDEPDARGCWTGRFVASSPVSSTSPASAGSSPAMIRRIVLLPDPDGPSSATSCPAGTSNETPSTAWKSRTASRDSGPRCPRSISFGSSHQSDGRPSDALTDSWRLTCAQLSTTLTTAFPRATPPASAPPPCRSAARTRSPASSTLAA